MVLYERVEYECEDVRVVEEPFREPLGAGLSLLAVGVVEKRQRLGLGELLYLAPELDAERTLFSTSSKSRLNARDPVLAFSSRIFSSGSVSLWGL